MTETQKQEIAEAEVLSPLDRGNAANLPMVPDDQTGMTVETIQRSAAIAVANSEVWDTIRRVFWSHVNPGDLIPMGEKAYLQGAGAQRGAASLGLSIQLPLNDCGLPQYQKIDLGDGDYIISVAVGVKGYGRAVSDVGSSQTGKAFFKSGIYQQHLKTICGGSAANATEAQQIKAKGMCYDHVCKQAIANGIGRAVLAYLGQRDLSWADIQHYNPALKKGAKVVDYKKRGESSDPR